MKTSSESNSRDRSVPEPGELLSLGPDSPPTSTDVKGNMEWEKVLHMDESKV